MSKNNQKIIGVLVAVASGLLAVTYAAVITSIIHNGLLTDGKAHREDKSNANKSNANKNN